MQRSPAGLRAPAAFPRPRGPRRAFRRTPVAARASTRELRAWASVCALGDRPHRFSAVPCLGKVSARRVRNQGGVRPSRTRVSAARIPSRLLHAIPRPRRRAKATRLPIHTCSGLGCGKILPRRERPLRAGALPGKAGPPPAASPRPSSRAHLPEARLLGHPAAPALCLRVPGRGRQPRRSGGGRGRAPSESESRSGKGRAAAAAARSTPSLAASARPAGHMGVGRGGGELKSASASLRRSLRSWCGRGAAATAAAAAASSAAAGKERQRASERARRASPGRAGQAERWRAGRAVDAGRTR